MLIRCGLLLQAGVRIVVHDTGQWPLIDEYGMNINPSSYTEVAITEVSIDVIQYTRDILIND